MTTTSPLPVADDFDGLFTSNYAALARLIYRVVGDFGWAEELAAEAFWKLHRNPPPSDQNLAGWLYRTGLRLALDNLKKRKRRAHYEAQAPSLDSVHDPHEVLERVERRTRVRDVLAALKTEQSALLILRSEGYTLGEIASILSLHHGSVGTLLARADQSFRKEYVKRYGEG
ncbi:MAG TPA: sigma-70 family RNA polymerase sigma factor [Bryobacteraceae bacterium]|nr:sigma-70 family RNA polymerase sigma factor [Bryobacteraceae bacterium]